jgi:hypothetical protein
MLSLDQELSVASDCVLGQVMDLEELPIEYVKVITQLEWGQ